MYIIKFCDGTFAYNSWLSSGGKDRYETTSIEEAMQKARSYAGWNLECEVVNLNTNEVIQHFDPYKKLFENV
jgi:hypothetical protein